MKAKQQATLSTAADSKTATQQPQQQPTPLHQPQSQAIRPSLQTFGGIATRECPSLCLLTTNALYLVLGIIVTGLGAFELTSGSGFNFKRNQQQDEVSDVNEANEVKPTSRSPIFEKVPLEVAGMKAGVNLVVTGFFITIVSTLGCFGVFMEDLRVLAAYATGLAISLVFSLVFIGIHAIRYRPSNLTTALEEAVRKGGVLAELRYSVFFELLSIVVNIICAIYTTFVYWQITGDSPATDNPVIKSVN